MKHFKNRAEKIKFLFEFQQGKEPMKKLLQPKVILYMINTDGKVKHESFLGKHNTFDPPMELEDYKKMREGQIGPKTIQITIVPPSDDDDD